MINQKSSQFLYKNKIDYFKDNERVKHRKKYSIKFEILTLILLTLVSGYYSINIDHILEHAEKHKHIEMEEFLIVLSFLISVFIVFSMRRLLYLKYEVKLRMNSEENVYKYALFDTLSGLPNRHVFKQNLEMALSRLEENSEKLAVHLIDLDSFKEINDTYGHEVGDKVLEITAKRIASVLRDGDSISRVGGDEFNIIQNSVTSPEDTVKLGDRIIAAFDEAINIGDHAIFITVSIGTTICNNNESELSKLLREADIAMYRAKEVNKSSQHLYNEDIGKKFTVYQTTKQELREAIKNGEFELYYQPQFTVDKKLIGFEALLRWMNPKRGMVSPGIFIPIAEECGLIKVIDEWVLKEACKAAAKWDEKLTVAVNVSAIQFKNKDFIEKVQNTLKLTGLNPKRLEIEVTEGVLISDIISAKQNILNIKNLGSKIVMDDFGIGYSSLSYLMELPFDKLKIDRSFIDKLESRDKNLGIIKAIVNMSKVLGISVMAEGVETEEQRKKLSFVGCYNIQGFLLGRPEPLKEAERLMLEKGFQVKE